MTSSSPVPALMQQVRDDPYGFAQRWTHDLRRYVMRLFPQVVHYATYKNDGYVTPALDLNLP